MRRAPATVTIRGGPGISERGGAGAFEGQPGRCGDGDGREPISHADVVHLTDVLDLTYIGVPEGAPQVFSDYLY